MSYLIISLINNSLNQKLVNFNMGITQLTCSIANIVAPDVSAYDGN